MVKLLERQIRTLDRRLILLAPWQVTIPSLFTNTDTDVERHEARLREVQRLRGGTYLRDGAVQRAELSSEGLHQTREDERSWHLVMVDGQQRITACVWYLQHDTIMAPQNLRVNACPLARLPAWRDTVMKAVALELSRAQVDRLRYVEIGGWAVATEHRGTCDGVLLALAAYSLGRCFGGALGLTTATVRHSSSTILRRLGGSPLEAAGVTVPPYFDPQYNCVMELLRFDSRLPTPQYAGLIELLRAQLATVLVVARHSQATAVPAPYELPETVMAPPADLPGYGAPASA